MGDDIGYEEWKNRSRTSYEAAAAWKYSFYLGWEAQNRYSIGMNGVLLFWLQMLWMDSAQKKQRPQDDLCRNLQRKRMCGEL